MTEKASTQQNFFSENRFSVLNVEDIPNYTDTGQCSPHDLDKRKVHWDPGPAEIIPPATGPEHTTSPPICSNMHSAPSPKNVSSSPQMMSSCFPINVSLTGDYRSLASRKTVTIKANGREVLHDGKFHLRSKPTFMHCKINDTEGPLLSGILDNCSGMSVISKKCFTSLNMSDIDTSVKLNIFGIGNQSSLGFVTCTVFIPTIDNRTIELDVQFHVLEEFVPNLCIGNDVIKSYGIDLITTENKAVISSIDVSFRTELDRPNHMDRPIAVKAGSAHVIDQNCHKFVGITSRWQHGRDYIFNPCHMSDPTKGYIKCPSSLISSNTSFLPISNFTDSKQKIHKGQLLGFATPVHKDLIGAVLDKVGPLDSEEEGTDVGPHLYFNQPDPVKLEHEIQSLNNNTGISEFCIISEELSHPCSSDPSKNAAEPIDPSDCGPPPHKVEPTWSEFDVAKDEKGKPHAEIIKVLSEHLEAFSLDGKPGKINDGTEISIRTGVNALPVEPL